jgi:hypothetical protein
MPTHRPTAQRATENRNAAGLRRQRACGGPAQSFTQQAARRFGDRRVGKRCHCIVDPRVGLRAQRRLRWTGRHRLRARGAIDHRPDHPSQFGDQIRPAGALNLREQHGSQIAQLMKPSGAFRSDSQLLVTEAQRPTVGGDQVPGDRGPFGLKAPFGQMVLHPGLPEPGGENLTGFRGYGHGATIPYDWPPGQSARAMPVLKSRGTAPLPHVIRSTIPTAIRGVFDARMSHQCPAPGRFFLSVHRASMIRWGQMGRVRRCPRHCMGVTSVDH